MEPPLCTNGSAGYLMQLSVNEFKDVLMDLRDNHASLITRTVRCVQMHHATLLNYVT